MGNNGSLDFKRINAELSTLWQEAAKSFLKGTEEDIKKFWSAIVRDMVSARDPALVKELTAQIPTLLELHRIRVTNTIAIFLQKLIEVSEEALNIGIRSVLHAQTD